MLPRRCKKCKCYVAPQLKACPRCRTVAPALNLTKPTKEEKQEARAKRDATVPTIHAKHMHWIPSAFSQHASRQMQEELKRQLAKADTVRARNAIRNEIRLHTAQLARVTVPEGKKGWTTEVFHAKHWRVFVFISPKKLRYVLAPRDAAADLIILNSKRRKGLPITRLIRFEKSPYARMARTEKHDEVVHRKRKTAKKTARRQKRRATPTLL